MAILDTATETRSILSGLHQKIFRLSADAVKKAVSPGLEWRSWRTTGSQSRESFIPGPTSVSPSGTRGKSRMHKGARTDPCGGRGATRVPTAPKAPTKAGAVQPEQDRSG